MASPTEQQWDFQMDSLENNLVQHKQIHRLIAAENLRFKVEIAELRQQLLDQDQLISGFADQERSADARITVLEHQVRGLSKLNQRDESTAQATSEEVGTSTSDTDASNSPEAIINLTALYETILAFIIQALISYFFFGISKFQQSFAIAAFALLLSKFSMFAIE
ncbi:hypothetical protein HII31_04006 [Pseudocercospora fuligena]|uniref:Uncharacterized protein n=1 Tax=Pseudocercospora fuligena TaxID=685502 RepID=A0A8H6VNK3_9PEZI|nr:hypothetical protein HII31_04006 [Pseudocercospora fuligena]